MLVEDVISDVVGRVLHFIRSFRGARCPVCLAGFRYDDTVVKTRAGRAHRRCVRYERRNG
jgi:hypothetical protein